MTLNTQRMLPQHATPKEGLTITDHVLKANETIPHQPHLPATIHKPTPTHLPLHTRQHTTHTRTKQTAGHQITLRHHSGFAPYRMTAPPEGGIHTDVMWTLHQHQSKSRWSHQTLPHRTHHTHTYHPALPQAYKPKSRHHPPGNEDPPANTETCVSVHLRCRRVTEHPVAYSSAHPPRTRVTGEDTHSPGNRVHFAKSYRRLARRPPPPASPVTHL